MVKLIVDNFQLPERPQIDLFIAAINNDAAYLSSALQRGESLDVASEERGNITPLQLAIEHGSMDFIAVAIEADFNPWTRDDQGRAAIDYARENSLRDIQIRLYNMMYPEFPISNDMSIAP